MRRYIARNVQTHAIAQTGGFSIRKNAIQPGPALAGPKPKHLCLKWQADVVGVVLCYSRPAVAVVNCLAFHCQASRKAEGPAA